MTNHKIAIGLVAVALFAGVVMAHADDLSMGNKAYQRGDYPTALRIYRQLAKQDDAFAQFNLGVMYDKGRGVPQSYKEAVWWYRKAADQGYMAAQTNLGAMYHNGHGVPRDYGEAVKWYRKAAEQGNHHAHIHLGFMYEAGRGVRQDYVQAHMWYNLSVVKGNKIAGESRDSLAVKMTPAQIAEAQKLAREWKPKGK